VAKNEQKMGENEQKTSRKNEQKISYFYAKTTLIFARFQGKKYKKTHIEKTHRKNK
jgi:hypothetical protein